MNARHCIGATLVGFILCLTVQTASAEASSRFCGYASNGLGVHAGSHTSCSFAKATANTWLAQRVSVIRVYSQVTGRRYTMHCRMRASYYSNPYLLCTGGNRAWVALRS